MGMNLGAVLTGGAGENRKGGSKLLAPIASVACVLYFSSNAFSKLCSIAVGVIVVFYHNIHQAYRTQEESNTKKVECSE